MIEPQLRNVREYFKENIVQYEYRYPVRACATLIISFSATSFERFLTLLGFGYRKLRVRTCLHLGGLQPLLAGFFVRTQHLFSNIAPRKQRCDPRLEYKGNESATTVLTLRTSDGSAH